jgi:hypothetical protein
MFVGIMLLSMEEKLQEEVDSNGTMYVQPPQISTPLQLKFSQGKFFVMCNGDRFQSVVTLKLLAYCRLRKPILKLHHYPTVVSLSFLLNSSQYSVHCQLKLGSKE